MLLHDYIYYVNGAFAVTQFKSQGSVRFCF